LHIERHEQVPEVWRRRWRTDPFIRMTQPEPRTCEDSAQNLEHHRQRVPLMAAHHWTRHIPTAEEGLAMRHEARLLALGLGRRQGHIEDDRRPLLSRDRHGKRVIAQRRRHAAPGCHADP
jgi:hypothetical protein